MSKYRDFDALDDEPLRFRAGGKEYEVPSDVPAETMLKLYRNRDTMTNDMDMFVKILSETLGEETYQEITQNIGFKKFQSLSQWVMEELLNIKIDEEAGEEGNAPSGEEKISASPSPSTPSSNTGHSLRPISGGIGLQDPQTIEGAVG